MLWRVPAAGLIALLLFGCKSSVPPRPWEKTDSDLPGKAHRPAPGGATAAGQNTIERVPAAVLRVGRETISVQDVLEPIRQQLEEAACQQSTAAYNQLLARLVQEQIRDLIQESLIYQQATKNFSEAQQSALDDYATKAVNERIHREFGGVRARFERHLAQFDKTIEDAKQRERRRGIVLQHLRRELLPRIHVTREELHRRYDRLYGDKDKLRREMFLIEVPIPAGGDRQAARQQIEEAAQRLQQGEPFDAVARVYSQGLQAEAGGAWGAISRDSLAGRYARCAEVLFELECGQTSEIIETDESLFLVHAGQEDQPEHHSFVDVQPELEARIKEEKLRQESAALIERLYQQVPVGELEPFIAAVVANAPRPTGGI